MAKMADGHADDLATAVLLATDKTILLAPAMNPHMWSNTATQRNLAQLAADGVAFVGPNAGEMAESGEAGIGRMAEPLEIVAAVEALLAAQFAARSPASACSSPRARRTSRSIRCATSPTARPASRATPSPQPRRRPAPR